MAVSERVSAERGEALGDTVSYVSLGIDTRVKANMNRKKKL